MTANDDTEEGQRSQRRSKVARVIQEYDLRGMEEELVTLWTGKAGEQRSLRELATDLNQELLRVAMEKAEMSPLGGEIENMYRLLTDDDVSSGKRVDAETTLERNGIDVEQLRRDFVSHQAIHTYLTEYRNVERRQKVTENRIETTIETIQRLQSRLIAVVEKSLDTLRDTEKFVLGDFSIFVDVQVLCEECGTQSEVLTLLRTGGCECEDLS